MNYQPQFQYLINETLTPLRGTIFFKADELAGKLVSDNDNVDPALASIFREKPKDLTNNYATYSDTHKQWL